MTFFNFFFCCCFNPFPVYLFKNNQTLNSFNNYNINWVYEGHFTKDQFLFKKHKISYLRLWMNRIIVTLLIFFILFFFPSLTLFIYSIIYLLRNFKFPTKKLEITKWVILGDFIISIILVIGIIIYTKLSFKPRYICFIFVICLVTVLLVLFVVFFFFDINVMEYKTSSTTTITSS